MNKAKQKIIYSWIALTTGVVSLLYIVYGTLSILHFISDNWMMDIWLLLLIAIVAIISGIPGLFDKVNKGNWARSLSGVISGLLFCGAFLIWCIYLIEW